MPTKHRQKEGETWETKVYFKITNETEARAPAFFVARKQVENFVRLSLQKISYDCRCKKFRAIVVAKISYDCRCKKFRAIVVAKISCGCRWKNFVRLSVKKFRAASVKNFVRCRCEKFRAASLWKNFVRLSVKKFRAATLKNFRAVVGEKFRAKNFYPFPFPFSLACYNQRRNYSTRKASTSISTCRKIFGERATSP